MSDTLPTRAAEALMIDLVRRLLDVPESEFGIGKGLARATHVAAFSELAYNAYFGSDKSDNTPGFLPMPLLDRIATRLARAHLQPQESRFRDILDWKDVKKEKLRDEMRANLMRLLCQDSSPYGAIGIQLHVMLDLRMSFNASGYQSAFEDEDLHEFLELRVVRAMYLDRIPGLGRAAA